MDSKTLKALALQYWRYDRQCPVVALEYGNRDVSAVTRHRRLIDTEVKVSIQDLRRDVEKVKHLLWREALGLDVSAKYPEWESRRRARQLYRWHREQYSVWEFFFVVPEELKDKALAVVEEVYPYAGLMYGRLYKHPGAVRLGELVMVRKARRFDKAEKLKMEEIVDVVRAQSATLTRLALASCSVAKGEQ